MRPTHLETRYKFDLTPRQTEILGMIERGRTNGEIASSLGITLDGAKYHVREIMTKLGVSSREEAVQAWRSQKPGRWRWFEGFAISGGLAKELALGLGALGVVVAITVAAWWAFGSGGNGEPASPDPSTSPAATPPATTTPASTLTATPTAPPSPTPVVIDGVTPQTLAISMEQPVPQDSVTYFTQVRPQSETINTRLWRAYKDAADVTHFDDLTTPLRERSAVGADPYTLAMSADGSTIMAAVCVEQASCGVGIMRPRQAGEAIPAALQAGPDGLVFRSEDGGASWQEIGTLPFSHRFVAIADGGTIVARNFDSATNGRSFSWYETGEIIDPPIDDAWPFVVPGLGLVWRPVAADNGPFVDPDGNVVHEPIFPDGAGETVIGVNPDGSRLVVSLTSNDAAGTWVLAAMDPAGAVTQAVSPSFALSWDVIPAPQFGPSFVVFWGTVADDPRFLPYLVDVRYRGAMPLLELTQVVDEYMSPLVLRLANFGAPPLRVNTPGDCLNIREDPSASGTILACAVDGTLLRELAEDVSGWVRVVTPAGFEGWAAEQFLIR